MKEKSLKLIADHIADWIYWVDTEGKAMFHSKSVEQFTEYTLEEISANENFLIDIMYDEDKEKYCEHKKIAYTENSETYELEFRIVTKSGKIKTIAHICKPIFEDGKYIGRIADNRDITFQKMQSETILTEKMRFDLYMDSIRDVLWEVDENYLIKYVSPAFEKIFGIPSKELIGKCVFELLNIREGNDLFNFLMDRRKDVLEKGITENSTFEVPYTDKEGKLIWFEVSSRPMMKNDKLVGFVGIARDITARKNYLTKLETITDIIENSILEFDIANNTITFNEKFYKMLGYSPDEFENSFENIIEHIHIDDRERVANSIQELISNKSGTFSHEYRMKTKEGSWKWVKCNGKITEWDKKGNPTKIIAAHIDIDKEKRLQEEKLLLLSSAINATSESVVITDTRGNIQYVNPAFSELTGYSLNEAIGKNPRDLVNSGEQNKEFYKTMWRTIANGKTWKGEIINRRKDGSKYVEFLTITPVKNDKGKIINYVAIKRDMTYERELIKELNKINTELQAIYDSSPVLISLLDTSSRIVYANKTTTDFLGIPLEELISKRACGCFGCIHETESDLGCGFGPDCSECKLNKAIQKTLETRQSVTGIEHDAMLLKNGQIIKYTFLATTSYIQSGNSGYVLLNLLDITEKKINQNLLEQSYKTFKTYIQAAPMGIVSIDKDGKIRGCNRAFQELLKTTEENLLDTNIFYYIFQRQDLFKDAISQLTKESRTIELIMQDTNEKIFWSRISAVPLKDDEILCFIEDIDDKKRAEEEQRALFDALRLSNQKIEQTLQEKDNLINELQDTQNQLQETIKAKDKFFSIISHDLRGPFSGFLGLTDMMAKDLEDLSLRELRKMSQAIYKSANSVYKLLDDLLQWSRLQLGKIPYNPEKITLKEIVNNSLYTLRELAHNKEIALSIDVPDDFVVYCDRNMITGVIRNLVTNGIKFTNRGGWIKIFVNKVEGGFAEIAVADNGVGIADEIKDKIFRLDAQVSTKGTEKETGSGLGLILCKEFVEKHGGIMYFNSKENEGTTFFFTLPIVENT